MDLSSIALPTINGPRLAFADRQGRHAVLILGNQKTSDVVRETERLLHANPETADVSVIQIAHLTGVPRMVRKMAERDIRRGLSGQLTALAERRTAQGLARDDSLVEVCLDWEGEVTSLLGFDSTDRQPLVAVLRADSTVDVTEPGQDAVAGVNALLSSR